MKKFLSKFIKEYHPERLTLPNIISSSIAVVGGFVICHPFFMLMGWHWNAGGVLGLFTGAFYDDFGRIFLTTKQYQWCLSHLGWYDHRKPPEWGT